MNLVHTQGPPNEQNASYEPVKQRCGSLRNLSLFMRNCLAVDMYSTLLTLYKHA